ncbi:MAG TPA: DEAD/DEAH box helicase [Polyangiaceae bacterium]|nr:DEAD/DEAH box helicase [Polyangiaceae bacterium]
MQLPPARPISQEEVQASAFTALGLREQLVKAVLQEGYDTPTPIQAQTIPHLLAKRDLLGSAQTGTGKTAAFVLPLLQNLAATTVGLGAVNPGAVALNAAPSRTAHKVRALILAPTRELAGQISERTAVYGRHLGIGHAVIYGGVSQHRQERDLARKPQVLIATPGRLIDLMEQRLIDLSAVEIFVLDEADTMLDMGFIHAVRRIVSLIPAQRQTLLFSATMPQSIEKLARSVLRNPIRVSVAPVASTADLIDQAVCFVSQADKRALLEQMLLSMGIERALVFTRTKHGANRVSEQLRRAGIEAGAIHGNKSQAARERALGQFRDGRMPVLVATDVAARGIDVEGISHVINFDLPNVPEAYVHRIGRTGRAGASGRAISFCDRSERGLLQDIERLIRKPIPVMPA